MKVGDKIYCKKDIKFFKKGGEYTIDKIVGGVNIKFFLICSSGCFNYHWFSNMEDNGCNYEMIWNYFCTKKKFRKIKLESLNKKIIS